MEHKNTVDTSALVKEGTLATIALIDILLSKSIC